MYGKVRLSKRQIKEDKFTSFMLSSKSTVTDNWQFFVIGVAAIILVIVGIVYWSDYQKTQAVEAGDSFARALSEYRQGNNSVAILGMTEMVNTYGNEQAAEQATYMLGNLHYENRGYEEAIRYYDMYLSKYRDDKLTRAAALAGKAACLENQANYPEAAERFFAAYEENVDGPLIGDYLYSSMRNYLQIGEFDKAEVSLDLIKDNFGESDLVNRSIRLFAEKGQG